MNRTRVVRWLRVLMPLGALAMSATDSPLRCVKPYGVELSRLRLRDPSFLPWGT